MVKPMEDGWEQSASAWIAAQGEAGDFYPKFVLDPVMMARVSGRGFARALDVGCGEGRFCRMLREAGIRANGVDMAALLGGGLAERRPVTGGGSIAP